MKLRARRNKAVWLRITRRAKARLLVTGYAKAFSACTALFAPNKITPRHSKLPVHRLHGFDSHTRDRTTLKVITLNVAHGRSNGRHQLLQSKKKIRLNLGNVAAVLDREQAHLVALQEADGPSAWSGDFDHVKYLANKSSYPYSIRANHVHREKMAYGTGILSALPLEYPLSIRFAPTPPTASKGFVVTTIAWPGQPDFLVDVISVHLDFARGSAQRKQVEELARGIGERNRPIILMGDFNCQWHTRNSALRQVATQLGLTAYTPKSENMHTFPKLRRRLDWILISPEFEYSTYEVLPDIISDHRGVVATLRIAGRIVQDSPEREHATVSTDT